MNHHFGIKFIVICILSVFTINAFAVECNEKSPNLIISGDDYYKLEKKSILSDADKEQLNKLYKSMKGEWTGDILFTDCIGPDSSPRLRQKQATITANIVAIDYLIVKLKLYFGKNRINKQMTMELFNEDLIYDFLIVSDNELVFSEKWRISSGAGTGSRFVENLYKINLNRKHLVLETLFYINGVYAGNEVLTMTKEPTPGMIQ